MRSRNIWILIMAIKYKLCKSNGLKDRYFCYKNMIQEKLKFKFEKIKKF